MSFLESAIVYDRKTLKVASCGIIKMLNIIAMSLLPQPAACIYRTHASRKGNFIDIKLIRHQNDATRHIKADIEFHKHCTIIYKSFLMNGLASAHIPQEFLLLPNMCKHQAHPFVSMHQTAPKISISTSFIFQLALESGSIIELIEEGERERKSGRYNS